uniref:BTB domain-containing protein n=1 Tax=Panagrolaimus sp. ES5 TaxID=591445 RepID=A0AC34GNL8_9BILA
MKNATLTEFLWHSDDRDFVISVGKDDKPKTDIDVHKCVFAYRSPVFREMFKNKMKEKTGNRFEIEDFDPKIVQAAVEFCYDQQTYESLEIDELRSLLEFADKFDIIDLKSKLRYKLAKPVHGKIAWPKGPEKKQEFSLPDSIMHYMAKNPPTSTCYNKLIQSCKYFFEQNPILVVTRMDSIGFICANEERHGSGANECCFEFDINKVSSKFWLTHDIFYQELSDDSNFVSVLNSKIYKNEIKWLTIEYQKLNFEEFKLLASSPELFGYRFFYCNIVHKDGSIVMLEELLGALPNVKDFEYYIDDFFVINASTLENISSLKNLDSLKSLTLYRVPENFDLDELYTFVKDRLNFKFALEFADTISNEYKNQLDVLIDKIIESETPNCFIVYHGQNIEKLKIMRELWFNDN